MSAAGPLGITFHRAFDAARDLSAALEQVVTLGCQRILSSGGQASALAGADVLAALVAQACDRISLMAGAGITAANAVEVAERSGCVELHASAKTTQPSAMRHHNPALTGLSPDWTATDVAQVNALRAALDNGDGGS
ncbi:Copper homeostasis protein CutC [compost metagenome]